MKPLEHGEAEGRSRRSLSPEHGLLDADSNRCSTGRNEGEKADPRVIRERVDREGNVRVGLSGELDLQFLPELRATLRTALGSQREVFVDLSEVSFLDALCLRELVVQYQLYPRLFLWRPSFEVKLALAICDLEDWVSFHPDRAASRRLARVGAAPIGHGAEDGDRAQAGGLSPGEDHVVTW